MYNYSKLRNRIIEKYKKLSNYSKKLNISNASLSAKLNNKVGFTQREINQSLKLLDIDIDEIYYYFFNQ
ncbi:MAG: DUF739 family protein [Clostridium sp.]